MDLWHSLEVPNDVDLLKQLANEGLQATAGETLVPKAPMGKKKGKKVRSMCVLHSGEIPTQGVEQKRTSGRCVEPRRGVRPHASQ